ncbi:uncharacterized protein LOC144666110 isoform X2 [Oculina patagonica]
MDPEPANAKPFDYTIGHDGGPADLWLSWFTLTNGTLSAEQAKEHADNTISQALQAVQVEVKFSTNSLRVQENVESIDLLAMRTGNVEIASIVRFSATSGTAKINKDFSFQSTGDFVFKPGEVYRSINVSILSDDFTEDDENFTVSIKSVDGGVTTVTQEGTVTITIASNTGPAGPEAPTQGQEEDLTKEFIWYLYPTCNGQLYGYRPKTNTSYLPEAIAGQVVVQKEDQIHGVLLAKNENGANKISLGDLNENLGNSSAFPSFTISFLFKFTYPLPEASKLRVFNAIPFEEERKNSNPMEIYLIQIGRNVSLHASVGHHDLVTDGARVLVPPVSQWNHATIVHHGSHENETEIYLNGTREVADLYEVAMHPEPANAKPLEYTIGSDQGPADLWLSWFSLTKETLTAEQAKEHADLTICQALQAVQVEVKFSTNSLRVQEHVESVNLLVMRTGNVEIASIVRFSASSGTAKINKDFSFPNTGDFVFRPGEVYRSINVPILSDDFAEDDENFTVSIESVDGGVTTVTQEGTVTITIASNTTPASVGPSGNGNSIPVQWIIVVTVFVVVLAIVLFVVFFVRFRRRKTLMDAERTTAAVEASQNNFTFDEIEGSSSLPRAETAKYGVVPIPPPCSQYQSIDHLTKEPVIYNGIYEELNIGTLISGQEYEIPGKRKVEVEYLELVNNTSLPN